MTTTTKHRKGGTRGGNQYGEYTVRHATSKQIAFIEKLLADRVHNLTLDLTQLNVQGAKEVIESLLKLEKRADSPATPKQIAYAQYLVRTKRNGFTLERATLDRYNVKELNDLRFKGKEVSAFIELLSKDKDLERTITEVGAYRWNGKVISVRIGRESGKWQVWEFNDSIKKWEFIYKKSWILLHLTPAMKLSLEEAIKVSAQTGTCVHCGRTLTDLKSVAGGMGKVCASKYGNRY